MKERKWEGERECSKILINDVFRWNVVGVFINYFFNFFIGLVFFKIKNSVKK